MSDQLQMALWLAAALAAMGLSAVFAGVETGIYCINRVRLRLRSESGHGHARTLFRLLRHQRSVLGALLLGTNIAHYVGSSAVVALFSFTRLDAWQIAIFAPLIFAPAILVVGEMVPKNIFQAYGERYTYSFVPLLAWTRWLMTATGLLPLVNAATGLLLRLTGRREPGDDAPDRLFHPRQQVGRLFRESSHQGTLTAYQSYLVDRVMNLRDVKVVQVMVPLAKVRSVPVDVSRTEFLARLRTHNFSRLPVYRSRQADIVGVVNTNAVLAETDPARPLADLVYDAPRVRPDSPVVHALFALQRARRALGIVVDRSGAAVGIVTIKDLVEEIVGEIEEW